MTLDLNQMSSTSPPLPPPSNPCVLCAVSSVRQKCGLVTSARHTQAALTPLVADVWNCSAEFIPGTEGRVSEFQPSGTYARRVQQVSPSTSAPGALSVLTDSFSLAGMLTGWQVEPVGREREGEQDESRVPGCCVIHAHKECIGSLRNGSETLNAIHNYTELLLPTTGGAVKRDFSFPPPPPPPPGTWGERNHQRVGCIPNRGVHFTATSRVAWRTLVNMDCVRLFYWCWKQQRLLDLQPQPLETTTLNSDSRPPGGTKECTEAI